jgi:hypothetical protein
MADSEYGARVRLVYEVPVAAAAGFCERLFDLSGGRVQARVVGAGVRASL